MKIEQEEKKYHLIGWAIWIILMCLIVQFQGPSLILYVASPILYFTPYVVFFYSLSLYVLPSYWPKHQVKLFFAFAIFCSIFIGYRYCTVYVLLPWFDSNFEAPYITPRRFVIAHFWWFFQMSFLAVGYFIYKRSIESMRKKNQLEKSLIRAETSFLMTQFNPHFLFNVLSYMYSKASRISEDLSNAIELLAEIMRYSLKDTNPSDRVSLADEWDHIENFIELNRLRFDNEIFVELNVQGDMLSKKIIPLILISLVENAFKHGKINDPKHPLYMTLTVDLNSIQFEIKNRKKNGTKDPKIRSLGIGNENVRKRLELAYGDDFEQIINEDENTYNYKLLIKEKSYAMPNY